LKKILAFFILAGLLPSAVLAASYSNAVNAVELQWVLCEGSSEILFEKLGVKAPEPKQREVYYSETAGLDLFNLGAILRTRVTKNKIKTAAKIKGFNETEIPWNLLEDSDSKCEWDAYQSLERIGCSLSSEPSSMKNLVSKDQKTFIETVIAYTDFQSLEVWGPVDSKEWEWKEESVKETLTLETLELSSPFFSMELSARVPLSKKAQTFQRVHNWLLSQEIKLCKKQEGKTGELLKVLIEGSYKIH